MAPAAPRRAALQLYFDAMVASFAEEVQGDIGERVCGLGSLLDGLPERLEILLTDTPAARENLIHFYEDGAKSIFSSHRAVRVWLESDRVFERVLQLYEEGVAT